MNETWRPILLGIFKQPSNYEVSDQGRVRNVATGRILKPYLCPKRNGVYLKVKLGRKYAISLHRLVAIAFIPNPGQKPEVNHKDTDTLNSRADNLEWATRQEQEIHKKFFEHRVEITA